MGSYFGKYVHWIVLAICIGGLPARVNSQSNPDQFISAEERKPTNRAIALALDVGGGWAGGAQSGASSTERAIKAALDICRRKRAELGVVATCQIYSVNGNVAPDSVAQLEVRRSARIVPQSGSTPGERQAFAERPPQEAPSRLSIAQSDQPVLRPNVVVGDRWIYRSVSTQPDGARSLTSEVRVSFVSSSAIVTVNAILQVEGANSTTAKARVFGRAGESELESEGVWTAEWNSVSSSGGAVYRDHSATFSFPLTPGKAYRADYEMSRPREGAAAWRHQRKARVIGWEEIVVPAGKFRAVKIEIDSEWNRLDVSRNGRSRSVIWYVPEVKRWAKSTSEDGTGTSTTELIGFQVR